MSGWDLCFVLFLLLVYNVLLPAVLGKPSFGFLKSLTSGFKPFRLTPEATAKDSEDSSVKAYSGYRTTNDSIQMVYYYDQTVAIAEVGPGKLLLSCELIEVVEPRDAKRTLKKLSSISKPLHVTLNEMITFMSQCHEIDDTAASTATRSQLAEKESSFKLLSNDHLTVLNGIVPGTKWCGVGDIAEHYHDLGTEPAVDRCCREHDICPVKIQAYTSRYNLTNNAYYTKSHCYCDDMLYACLKDSSNSTTAQLLGRVYFNIVQVPCIDETPNGRQFRPAKTYNVN